MTSPYKSTTHGPIPLSITGRQLLQNLREAVENAIHKGDFCADGMALPHARGALAQYLSKLENAANPEKEENARLRDEIRRLRDELCTEQKAAREARAALDHQQSYRPAREVKFIPAGTIVVDWNHRQIEFKPRNGGYPSAATPRPVGPTPFGARVEEAIKNGFVEATKTLIAELTPKRKPAKKTAKRRAK